MKIQDTLGQCPENGGAVLSRDLFILLLPGRLSLSAVR